MQRTKSAGDTVESQCTRCKALLNHTIVAMVNGQVVRVKCNTCGSEHNHRPVKELKEPKATVAKGAKTVSAAKAPRTKAVKGPVVSDETIWEEMIRPFDPDLAVPYSMEGKFKANSLVAHPTFGIGMVSLAQQGKIEVVFKAGRKLLRCAC